MLFKFNKFCFFAAGLLLVTEVLIALYMRDKIVRPYVGDGLVVILMYCIIRSFLSIRPFTAAVLVLIVAFGIEGLQYINIVERIGWHNSALARTVIGTSSEWIDLLAYTVGVGLVLLMERHLTTKKWVAHALFDHKRQ